MSNIALITGITGQDGSFLAEFLLKKGWRVYGMIRRSSAPNLWRIRDCNQNRKNLHLLQGDVTDLASMIAVIKEVEPTHVFNLAAQSFVPTSWNSPLYTAQCTGMGAVHVLEACRLFAPQARIYQASSSEMFGLQQADQLQNEETNFHPRSPYGCAKAYAHRMAVNYRESYDMFVSCGILFNHESERRGHEFVTRKIARAVAEIAKGKKEFLVMGTLTAERDWGFAGDYVEAMTVMLEHEQADDFVIATGVKHSVEYFVSKAFEIVDLDWQQYIKQDPKFMRPAEIPALYGDSSKAKRLLGWEPKMKLDELIQRMVSSEIERIEKGITTDILN